VPGTADGTVHRWIGVAALRAIWQEKLDVVKAPKGGMQSDKRAAMNILRSGIAEMKGKERSYDLQNTRGSL
jgi:hypothetical protein